jgi:kinesin family protein 13
VLVGCVIAALASDEQRSKKKDDGRGKRNLQYSIAHHYNGPHAYRLERRISTGSQIPIYHSQFFPGPRSYSPFHKGRPHSLPPPPYAVQMEPLVHYSQRDPLYDTNSLSLNADGPDDLLTDNNHLSENVYGPPQKHIIERPVYIKEPEPIIEIIIKESNVTLPPPPAPPAPPPKKKEQVQVFYVKYKKNPNGHGKDSIIYDKPIPAISPPVQDEHEEPPPQTYHHQEVVTSAPPPSTTLRTIIRPDSETYHSPSGVKVTFGKEGFDYDKRSSKPEDLKASPDDNRSIQFPQGRQLSSFPPSPPRRPSNYNFNSPPSSFRQPQPYRPFSQYRQTPQNYRSSQPPYSTLPKLPQFPQPAKTNQQFPPTKTNQQFPPTKTNQQFPPPRPVPPQFQQRQPVPYQPFDSLRQPQPIQFRPQTHFPATQSPPITQKPVVFSQFSQQNGPPRFGEERPQQKPQYQQKPTGNQYQQPQHQPVTQHKPSSGQYQQPTAPQYHQPPTVPQHHSQRQQQSVHQQPIPQHHQQPISQHHQQVSPQYQQQSIPQHPQHQPQSIPQHPQHQSQSIPQHPQHQPQGIPQHPQHQQQINSQQPVALQHHQYQQSQYQQSIISQSQQFNQQPSIIPPGGELIQSLPKFEQHISVEEPFKSPSLQQSPQPQFQNHQQPQYQSQAQQSSNQLGSTDHNQKIQQQLREANALQESIRQSSPQFYNFQQSQQLNLYQSTPKPITYSTTPRSTTYSTTPTTTTTQEPEKPSTTTKDPKILNAQLPDEVPDDLRQQLLSSGILNHADISVLDYDKVGDIPISALPPDQLANFYSAGGAQQIQAAGSAPQLSVAAPEFDAEESEIHEVTVKPEVQMKVVRYDPESDRGQQVQEAYVKDDATQVEPVVLNDAKYNRYLPLKVSGAQFPIPDVPELKGKKISSVVVLAPVAYDFSSTRNVREAKIEEVELVEGRLKDLLENPTRENFNKFLEKENRTRSDKQAVILLVTG